MKFFLGPKKLWDLYQNKDEIASKMKMGKDTAWYLSEEGKKAYENANTQGKRVRFEVIYKIAHIMANSMDKSSLPFGGYPNILQADKNPLIHCFFAYYAAASIFSINMP